MVTFLWGGGTQYSASRPLIGFSGIFVSQSVGDLAKPHKIHNLVKLYPGFSPDSLAYTILLKSFAEKGSLMGGKILHAHMILTSFKSSVFLLNNLLNFYCKCGDMYSASLFFNKMPNQNVVSWNSLISGYSHWGFYDKALRVFMSARRAEVRLDKFSYACSLSVCAQTGNLDTGRIIHGISIVGGSRCGTFLANSLIDMYAKCGRIDQARSLFDGINELDDVAWNSMIAAYVRIGLSNEAFKLLVQMLQLGWNMNTFALSSLLKGCSVSGIGESLGKLIHGLTIKVGLDTEVIIGGALLDMYAKIGKLNDALKVFKLMPYQNLVAFNAMIAGLFRQQNDISIELVEYALSLFCEILRRGMGPSKFTFSSIIRACSMAEAFAVGQQIHAQVLKIYVQLDEFIGNSLVDFYSKLGSIEDSWRCFNAIPKQDRVSWTSMIAGCVRSAQCEQALRLFYGLLANGMEPDEFTLSSGLIACANLGLARAGEQIQGFVVKRGFNDFTVVGNSQISMYTKSGNFDSAKLTFREMANRDVVSWSALISSHAQHGCAVNALRLFYDMKGQSILPNDVTFLGLLTACSHSGLVNEGFALLQCMKTQYGIDPNVKHMTCLVDLLGRAGRLVDAEKYISSSSFKDDPEIWRALLGACRIHCNTDIGQRIARRVIDLEPQASASYILLYNLYLNTGKKSDANRIRDLMKERGIKKEPGLSWIDIGTGVHSFVAGDKSHPDSQLIYGKLEEMLEKIKKMDCVISTISSCSKDEEQNTLVNHHSEKLAVAFGMITLSKLAPIRVMKNLRVCGDCHKTMKYFSQIERRDIVLRDLIRFHHFSGGSCSCGDYW